MEYQLTVIMYMSLFNMNVCGYVCKLHTFSGKKKYESHHTKSYIKSPGLTQFRFWHDNRKNIECEILCTSNVQLAADLIF